MSGQARLKFFRAVPFPRLRVPLPLFSSPVCAGFPSPANDHIEGEFDLNELLVTDPPATFLLRAAGLSMAAVDQINASYGRGTVRTATAGFSHRWQMRRDHKSPSYTTRLDDVPVARLE